MCVFIFVLRRRHLQWHGYEKSFLFYTLEYVCTVYTDIILMISRWCWAKEIQLLHFGKRGSFFSIYFPPLVDDAFCAWLLGIRKATPSASNLLSFGISIFRRAQQSFSWLLIRFATNLNSLWIHLQISMTNKIRAVRYRNVNDQFRVHMLQQIEEMNGFPVPKSWRQLCSVPHYTICHHKILQY